jgi:hypothetical protein
MRSLITAILRILARDPWRCVTGRHRLGSLHELRDDGTGYAVYHCADCASPLRLRASWACAKTAQIPSLVALATVAVLRIERATREETNRRRADAVARLRAACRGREVA